MENTYPNPAEPVFDPREKDRQVMSVSDWFVTQLLMIIPLVNLILLIVWAVSSTGNRNRANWAKASLIWVAIVFGLYFLVFIIAVIVGMNASTLSEW